jgi:arylsulfatase A-like enzyme
VVWGREPVARPFSRACALATEWDRKVLDYAHWLTIGFLGAVLAACASDERPTHVVLISVDTLRRDRVGLYGYERDTTPEIDAFFRSGTRFDSATSPSPCTVPSVPQLLFGSYEIRPTDLSLADTLRSRGFTTAAVVSQHLLQPAWHRAGAGARLARVIARGFDHFDVQSELHRDVHGMSARSARVVSERALAWLEAAPADTPFFLWLHYYDPHDPYEPPREFRIFGDLDDPKRSGDRRTELQEGRHSDREPWQRAGYVFDETDVAQLSALYDGEIRFVDAEIGRVLRTLEERGLVERSLIVFVSDHGEWLGEDDRWDHCQTLNEVEIGVPFLWSVNGGPLEDREHVESAVSTLDFVPTVLDQLGVEVHPDSFDGRVLTHSPESRTVFADWRGWSSARRGNWKLLQIDQPVALHDLAATDGESVNRLGEGIPVEAELSDALAGFRRKHDLAARNREYYEQLRSLGYID